MLGDDKDCERADPGHVSRFLVQMDTDDFGPIEHLFSALSMSPPRWDLPPVRSGAHEPCWLPR